MFFSSQILKEKKNSCLIYSHSPSALGVIEKALVVKPMVAEFISRPNLKRVKKVKKNTNR